ncbi:MAG: hypothetical protein LBE71_06250 [Dysgonamonadaceae bacterium]|nr:hypothetical protein [Dysgonamonadaceae bacterium]
MRGEAEAIQPTLPHPIIVSRVAVRQSGVFLFMLFLKSDALHLQIIKLYLFCVILIPKNTGVDTKSIDVLTKSEEILTKREEIPAKSEEILTKSEEILAKREELYTKRV